MNAELTIGVCGISHDRPDQVLDMVESARAEGVDEIVVLDAATEPPLEPMEGVRLIRSERNPGVASGRNRVAREVSADVLLFIDDDAVLKPGARDAVLSALVAQPGIGAVAFRIERADGTLVGAEQAFPADRRRGDRLSRPGECACVIGCAFAVRREAYDATGGFDTSMVYAHQDVDLAFRLVGDGWRIWYEPTAGAVHRPSPRGRGNPAFVIRDVVRNRAVMVRRNLPISIAIVHSAVWAVLMLRSAVRERVVREWARGLFEGWRAPVERRPLPWSTLAHVHRLGGRVLY